MSKTTINLKDSEEDNTLSNFRVAEKNDEKDEEGKLVYTDLEWFRKRIVEWAMSRTSRGAKITAIRVAQQGVSIPSDSITIDVNKIS